MIVAGGLYFETCEVPRWSALYGSGGRAAAALVTLSHSIELHTYISSASDSAIEGLQRKGIKITYLPSSTGIAFSYFHPLSRPVIHPPLASIPQHQSLTVSAESVLRFGFLEGDVIVSADRAVYDPQSSNTPEGFAKNGSRANELALVLNESELRSLGHSDDIFEASRRAIRCEDAAFVVVKQGARGAAIIFPNGTFHKIPAYKSRRVFKIGTGDVFSAVFAHYWAESRFDPIPAANLASRAVASYVESTQLPLTLNSAAEFAPIQTSRPGKVLIYGTSQALEDRWLLEEARWCVRDLGLAAYCSALGDTDQLDADCSAVLIIGDGTAGLNQLQADTISTHSVPAVVFSQNHLWMGFGLPLMEIIDDFTTAIYTVCWHAIGSEET